LSYVKQKNNQAILTKIINIAWLYISLKHLCLLSAPFTF